MGFLIVREWRSSASRPVGRPSLCCSRPQGASRSWSTAATASARSRCRPFIVAACTVVIVVLAASCGGDDASDGDTPDSVEASETEDEAAVDGDGSADSDDAREAADDEGDTVESDDDDEADTKAAIVREATPAPPFESPAFSSAYETAHSAFTEYLLLRHEDYLQALSNVDMALELAAIQRADSLAALENQVSNYESDTNAEKRAVRDQYQRERDAATSAERSYRAEVDAILDAALEEAQFDADDERILWEITGEDSANQTELATNCYNCDLKIGDIVAYTAWRLTFDVSYLALLGAEISGMGDSPIRVAVVAARDAAAAIAAANSLPYESADDALVGSIDAALAVSRNRSEFIGNIKRRIDAAIDYYLNRGERGAEAVAAASLKENLSRDLANIDQMEFSELAALDESLADNMDQYVNLVAAVDENHRHAVARIAGTISDTRSAFDFDRWSSAAFLLANTYLGLASTAQHVESSLRDSPEFNDPESMVALDYASALRYNLASVADAAIFLIDNYTPRTILDVETEFAEAAETLLLEAEKFENQLDAIRASAEALAESLDL